MPESYQGAGLGANASDQHHKGFKKASKKVSFFSWHTGEEALESSQGFGNVTSLSSVTKPFMGDVKSVTEMITRPFRSRKTVKRWVMRAGSRVGIHCRFPWGSTRSW